MGAAYFSIKSQTKNLKKCKKTEEKQQENGIDDMDLECKWCCANYANVLLKDCGHSGICKMCWLEYITQKKFNCHICRTLV